MKRFLFVAFLVVFLVGMALAVPTVASAETCPRIYEGGKWVCQPAFFDVGSDAYEEWQAQTRAQAKAVRQALEPGDPFIRWPWRGERTLTWAPVPTIPDWLWDIINSASR